MEEDLGAINNFAKKWLNIFQDPQTCYQDLLDNELGPDCYKLNFEPDILPYLAISYKDMVTSYKDLEKYIHYITFPDTIGSIIYSRWVSLNKSLHNKEEVLNPENRSWFILALKRLLIISNEEVYLLEGGAKTIHLTSICNSVNYLLEAGLEQEHHLTIDLNGQVSFSTLNHPYEEILYYRTGRSQELNIGKPAANKILNAVGKYFSGNYSERLALDAGLWYMEVVNKQGHSYFYRGSLVPVSRKENLDLSAIIRNELAIDNLYLLDGEIEADKVDRICIDYNRKVKVKARNHQEEGMVKVYRENLIIDRESESIEYIQDNGGSCTVSRKFQFKGKLGEFLDGLDSHRTFEFIHGKSSDIIENPYDLRRYKITMDLSKTGQRTIEGKFYKQGLPRNWNDFIQNLLNFMSSYDQSQILNPAIYNFMARKKGEYIYCSVSFDNSYKTYYYLTDDYSINVGDLVMVPVGQDDNLSTAKVIDIEYFKEEDVPFPLDKIKKIIRN